MIHYASADIAQALREVGIQKKDTVFLSARFSSIGHLNGVVSSHDFCQKFLNSIFEVIGESGTLVVPTYTQQVGRFGVSYVHETTPTAYGEFYEFIRAQKSAIRSFHPVFSLTAIGANAKAICEQVDTSAFGVNSAFGNLFRNGGKSLSIGFDYSSGNIVKAAHYIESTYGVPYYYNKILDAEVYQGGKKSDKVFILNVGYRQFDVEFDYTRYIEALDRSHRLRQAKLGQAMLYASDLQDQQNVGYRLLAEDVYSFLKRRPQFRKGHIPYEGCEETILEDSKRPMNWGGVGIARGWS